MQKSKIVQEFLLGSKLVLKWALGKSYVVSEHLKQRKIIGIVCGEEEKVRISVPYSFSPANLGTTVGYFSKST